MTDTPLATQTTDPDPAPSRDDEGELARPLVEAVERAVAQGDAAALAGLVSELHEADFADLLEQISRDERQKLVSLLGRHFPAAALAEVDERVRDDLVESLPAEQVASAVRTMESDDALYVLEDLDQAEREAILDKIPMRDRLGLERGLDYPDDSAGRLMRTQFIAVPPFWSVGQVIDYLRDEQDLPDDFNQIYIVDPMFKLLGIVELNRLLRTKRSEPVSKIMHETHYAFRIDEDQEEVARQFERYNLLAAPVVDASSRLMGIITVDDMLEVVQEEAEEDILRLGGVGDESLSDNVWEIARSRFIWLLINLGTAILASLVISLFDATIQQMVALAVLMPIVASMGGNAATQTMTVAVRALATKDLGAVNAQRIITRETIVGVVNGLMFAIIMGVVTALWFGNSGLGWVIAAAMIINLLVAGLAGILIPLVLDWFGIDPAIASSVFVTTLTDVAGFFAFLGLASLWLGA